MFYGVIGAMALGGVGDIAGVLGDARKYARYKGSAQNLVRDMSENGMQHLTLFQKQISAIENSNLNDIQKRIAILDKWKDLERNLPPDDFIKMFDHFEEQIDSVKKILARDIKFDLARDFAKSDLAYFIDDLQKIEDLDEIDVLISSYKKAKASPESFREFVELVKRRGKSCGL